MKIARAAVASLGLVVLSAAPMVVLTGCSEPPPPPSPPPPPPPPPPPAPVQVELASLMRGIDARVQFPQEKAPYDATLADTVIAFAAGLAAGDDGAMGMLLSDTGRGILDSMIADGTWFDATENIEAVRVVFLSQNPDGAEDASYAEFVLAVQDPSGAYALGWSATDTDGGWVIGSLETVDLTLPRASDWDGDSFGQYQSANGWTASGASAGSFSAPAAGGDMEAVLAYLSAETMLKLTGQGSLDSMTEAQKAQIAQVAQGMGGPGDAMAMIERGRDAVAGGTRPGSAEVKQLVDGLVMAATMMGQSWDADAILDAMAGVLGVSSSEMRTLYDG